MSKVDLDVERSYATDDAEEFECERLGIVTVGRADTLKAGRPRSYTEATS